MSKTPELKCPRCKNATTFQSEGHKHRCGDCGKFFSQRVEITEPSHRNRVFNGPVGTR